MTLAFELSALRALADPAEAVADARQWTEYLGIVSDEPTYAVTNFARKRRIRQDFFSGPKDKGESLAAVREQFDTDRHVFVGTSDADAALAAEHGWEYQPVEDAADAAGWALATDEQADDAASEGAARDDWP
ncbi:MAG: hypothetical protein ABEJ92_08270 [Halobacteriales archaeon]